ncbi:MAG: hypothetical protein LQ349_009253 [Xanthoria aureola]|nr:MAG: hypothetical protein LQ349_009253 [Xanthoria aureola]
MAPQILFDINRETSSGNLDLGHSAGLVILTLTLVFVFYFYFYSSSTHVDRNSTRRRLSATTCRQFMNNFLRNETFTSCLPFSLLLQKSTSFFSVTKSFSAITRTLDAACRPIDATCNPLMMSIASQLRQDENCAADHRREQPLVVAAYNGLVAYEVLYKAGCARDAGTGNYCFANAITNTSSPTDNNPYYLPLGIALPGGNQPSCTTCLRETMQIFNEAASEKNQQALIRTLPAAAQMINVGCGPGFANGTIPSAGQNVGAISAAIPRWSTVVLLALSFATMTGLI